MPEANGISRLPFSKGTWKGGGFRFGDRTSLLDDTQHDCGILLKSSTMHYAGIYLNKGIHVFKGLVRRFHSLQAFVLSEYLAVSFRSVLSVKSMQGMK